ncbi:Golgi SNAP receptor complex member 2-like [Eriocheir sinensis]|uniref:Golgi SNAP receptor complex member 2-like n=1 Tax=Eriocheir sinensis TaxID=95602 RepID=UPI0021C8E576|nr:Golgi SNAP receptor complex member 2-like [Eriocheir sinensis]XP_050724002.1 Golgi SNAP receptor complex member 2-like [Eriocheir sinensis]XP_050724003.1 Golgi SNAP receptor complex member 2-like [Eriocheir sinensis]XP_050724030.1 Golgi SNAP receptor complex member 2-like [Eriocheir sinensis]XP_050724032.1 Golgi SNAP receptor complex member 2-like [Eriocheir sinensis]
MEVLYHQTNRLLQEVTSQDLIRIQRAPASEDCNEAENLVVQKLDAIHANCNRLDILINKEPAARRATAKYRVDQLKYDLKHVQNSFGMLQHQKQMRVREVEEREALLSRKFTTNDQQETSIFLDHELQHHDKLGEANRNMDEMLGAGRSILEGIQDQGMTLKGARKKVLDLANTLGLSNTVMRMIERRSTQDKYILFAGMVIVLLCLYLALRYL